MVSYEVSVNKNLHWEKTGDRTKRYKHILFV